MPKKRLSMRKIREVLRLKYECKRSNRDIGRSCGIGSSTVSDYLQRAKMAGLNWPLPDQLDDTSLERQLFPPATPLNRDVPVAADRLDVRNSAAFHTL